MLGSRLHRVVASTGFGLLFATGCYGYYAPLSTNLVGRRIEVSLTDSGAVALAPRLGNGVEAVEGTLVADSASQYVVSALGTRKHDGQENSWRGESVNIPQTMVARVTERRFSRARTSLFLAATTAALVAIRRAFGGGGFATAPGNTGGPSGPK